MPTAHKKKKTSKKVRRKMRAGSALRLDIDDLPDDPSALKETLRELLTPSVCWMPTAIFWSTA